MSVNSAGCNQPVWVASKPLDTNSHTADSPSPRLRFISTPSVSLPRPFESVILCAVQQSCKSDLKNNYYKTWMRKIWTILFSFFKLFFFFFAGTSQTMLIQMLKQSIRERLTHLKRKKKIGGGRGFSKLHADTWKDSIVYPLLSTRLQVTGWPRETHQSQSANSENPFQSHQMSAWNGATDQNASITF